MSLSCYCDYDPEPGDICWYRPHDFTTLKMKRSRRCRSCGCTIRPGDDCAAIERYKVPDGTVECRIYGEDGEIPRATHYWCETCAGLAFSLHDLGFCFDIGDDMRGVVKKYAALMLNVKGSL